MTRARQGKGQGRAARGQARGKGGRARARSRSQSKHRPGILESWEDFNEAAMAEYLEAVTEDFAKQMDALEEALRGEN